jgi:hypothetical protein
MKPRFTHFFAFFALVLIFPSQLRADTQRSEPPCDTLFTTDGRTYQVRLIDQTTAEVRFLMCDDASATQYTLPLERVQRISRTVPTVVPVEIDYTDPLVRRARQSAILGLMASILVFTVYFTLPAIVLGLIAIVNGERILRKINKHPFEAYIRRKARRAVVAGLLTFVIPFVLFFLFGILLA